MTNRLSNAAIAILAGLVMAACASAPYRYQDFDPELLASSSETQAEGPVSVTAAVPGQDLARQVFGFPIYDRGIQPVWLSITNDSDDFVRYAPTGTDPDYFSALEVAYMHRKGYSRAARADMEQRLFKLRMPRVIPAGQTRSGFVFTNQSPGTKNVFVDVFTGAGQGHSFVYFLTVPGFEPDHAHVEFDQLYQPEQRVDLAAESLRSALKRDGCCTVDHSGEQQGLPVSLVFVGDGEDVLACLLRSGWAESPWSDSRKDIDPELGHFLFGRLPDAKFRFLRSRGDARNELNVWLAPQFIDGEPVWMGQITHFLSQRTFLEQALYGYLFDPNMDDARNFLLQNFAYSQCLDAHAWVNMNQPVSPDSPAEDFLGASYFTDGYRLVLWVSKEPVSIRDMQALDWDSPPMDLRKSTP